MSVDFSLIVYAEEESGVAIVGSIFEKVGVEVGDDLSGAELGSSMAVLRKRRLDAGHQQRGENPLAADVRQGDAHACGTEGMKS